MRSATYKTKNTILNTHSLNGYERKPSSTQRVKRQSQFPIAQAADVGQQNRHSSQEFTESLKRQLVRQFPSQTDKPNRVAILKSILEFDEGASKFAADDWVEIFSLDQSWHLAKIARVIVKESEEDDQDRRVQLIFDSLLEDKLEEFKQNLEQNFSLRQRPVAGRRNSAISRDGKSAYEEFKRAQAEKKRRSEGGDGDGDGDEDGKSVTSITISASSEDVLEEDAKDEVAFEKKDFFYNSGYHKFIPEFKVRASKEGLLMVFGGMPFLWQQYTLLRYENLVRFQENSEFDFENLDPVLFAKKQFNLWIKNSSFKEVFYDPKLNQGTRDKLTDHLYKPFLLLDKMRAGDDEEFHFDEGDDSVSAFTYLSILGSGVSIPLVCFVLQFMIYILVSLDQKEQNGIGLEEIMKCPVGDIKNTIVILGITTLYAVQVVPDTVFSFFNTVGSSDSLYSRLMSLRKVISDKDEDNTMQKIGYVLDLFMNTGFKCMLYALNLLIIFNTDDLLDVILNCIALEFVASIDEGFVVSAWWDPNNRWLKAGAMELVIRGNLELTVLEEFDAIKSNYFRDYFDEVELNEIYIKCDLKHKQRKNDKRENEMKDFFIASGFRSEMVSEKDSEVTEFLTVAEGKILACKELIMRDIELSEKERKRRNSGRESKFDAAEAQKELFKQDEFFGYLTWFREKKINKKESSKSAVFNKFKEYRTWSFFDVILFDRPIEESEQGETPQEDKKKFTGRLGWVNIESNNSLGEENCDDYEEEMEEIDRIDKEKMNLSLIIKFFNEDVDIAGFDETEAEPTTASNPVHADSTRERKKTITEVVFGDQTYKNYANYDRNQEVTSSPVSRFKGEIFNIILLAGLFREVWRTGLRHPLKILSITTTAAVNWIIYVFVLIYFPLLILCTWFFLFFNCIFWRGIV